MKCHLSIATVENNEVFVRSIKPASVSVKKSVTDLIDTAEITLPHNPYIRQDNTDGTLLQERGVVFNIGDKVKITMGYDDDIHPRFEGFVARIDKSVPMKVYCEGYAYQLRDKIFNKSYATTTLRGMLNNLIEGTDIVISPHTADVTIPNVFFKSIPALKVLEWIAKELLCSVWFDGNALYAGPSLYALPKPTQAFRLGYNTVKDDGLQKVQPSDKVQISIVEKQKTGTTKKVKDATKKYSATKEVKIRTGTPLWFQQAVASELQKAANYRGYEGKITTFLIPYVDKAYTVELSDNRYPDRAGRYFVESVDTSFSSSGGRQTIKLTYYAQ